MKPHWISSGIFFAILVCCTAQGQEIQYPRAIPVQTPSPATPAATPVAAATPVPRVEINDVACFIAGLPVTSGPLAALEQTPEWTNYAASLNPRWARFDTDRLQPVRLWTGDAIGQANTQRLFYPFSGPDFVYAATMFPNANTYILCGLEPVGTVPDINNLQPIDATLGWLQASTKTLIEAGYFVTKDMKVELNMSPLKGTLPLICVMLVRLGDHITSIKSDSSHAEIHFVTAAGGPERTVFYFSTDLSNGGMGRRSAFLNFLRQVRPDTAYVKSASYLMHGDEFSAVRNFLLTECSIIVQDDSGVPLRDFDMQRWQVRLYGTYAAPLDIFAKYYQKDLADLYSKTTTAPLPFGAGYHFDPKTANLMVATARR